MDVKIEAVTLSPKFWRLNSTKIGRYENSDLIDEMGNPNFSTPLYANLFTNTPCYERRVPSQKPPFFETSAGSTFESLVHR